MPTETILIVDDEESIRSALSTYLMRLGYDVLTASSGPEALSLAQGSPQIDLVLLDVILDESDPTQMSGIEVCRQLRQRSRFIPIIMLTSYPEWQVESLGQGAIAFMTKPWDNTALATQIRTTLSAVAHIRQENRADVLTIGEDLTIDLNYFRVQRAGQEVDLTPIEFALLAFLAKHPNRVWSREELLDHVWGVDWVGYPRTVDRHVAALRRKLGLARDELIETMHGMGYRLVT
jgi:DNA-binding response OmpR family regulator